MPITLTGTASIGMSVARQLCRKRNTTSVTSTIASASVTSTSLMDAVTNGVVSNGIAYVIPLRERLLQLVHPRDHGLLHRERVGAGPREEQAEAPRACR